jgi:hypothetical protein
MGHGSTIANFDGDGESGGNSSATARIASKRGGNRP